MKLRRERTQLIHSLSAEIAVGQGKLRNYRKRDDLAAAIRATRFELDSLAKSGYGAAEIAKRSEKLSAELDAMASDLATVETLREAIAKNKADLAEQSEKFDARIDAAFKDWQLIDFDDEPQNDANAVQFGSGSHGGF